MYFELFETKNTVFEKGSYAYELFPKLFSFYVSKKIKFFFQGTLMRQDFSYFLGFTNKEMIRGSGPGFG